MDEAKETAELKSELSREGVHDILQGMQDLPGMCAVVDSQRARSATLHLRATPAGNASGGLASVGDLAKSKTKRKGRPSTAVHLALLLIGL